MDQLKIAADFVWKHRFWFAQGLAVILASLLYFSGADALDKKTKQVTNDLNSVFSNAEKYRSGAHPNQRWAARARDLEQSLGKVVDDVWLSLYQKQAALFTWPAKVAKPFQNRPFGADLSDDRSQLLIQYKAADSYDAQLDDAYYLFDGIEQDRTTGDVYGCCVVPPRDPLFYKIRWGSKTPKSIEAWLAQEDFWVVRTVAKAVAKCNEAPEPTQKTWQKTVIREIREVRFGASARDSERAGEVMKNALEGTPEAAAAAAGAMAGGAPAGGDASGMRGRFFDRYLERNNQYRTIPVFVSLGVAQGQIQRVLAAFSEADFGFTITQAAVSVPEKPIEIPKILVDTGRVGRVSEREDPAFNTLQVDIWGVIRLFEMPPAIRAKYDEAKKAADAAAAQPADAAAKKN